MQTIARRARVLRRRGSRTWVGATIARSSDLRLGTHTLAIAAQQVMCTLPLLMAVSAIMQHFHVGMVVGMLGDLLQLDGSGRAALATLFATKQRPDLGALAWELVFGVGFLVGLAATTQDMLEEVWAVQQSRWGRMVRQYVWVAAASPCLALAMFSGRYVHRVLPRGHMALLPASVLLGLLAMAFYWWTQHVLLGGRVSWRALLPGSALSGLGMALATIASATLVPGQLVEQVGYYGPIGAAMVLSLWLFGVTIVVVVAALAGAVLEERRGDEDAHRPGTAPAHR